MNSDHWKYSLDHMVKLRNLMANNLIRKSVARSKTEERGTNCSQQSLYFSYLTD